MFLTRLPCPSWCDHHPTYLMRSIAYFPLFGILIGAWGAVFFNAGLVLWPPVVAAAFSTLATVWLTGAPPPHTPIQPPSHPRTPPSPPHTLADPLNRPASPHNPATSSRGPVPLPPCLTPACSPHPALARLLP